MLLHDQIKFYRDRLREIDKELSTFKSGNPHHLSGVNVSMLRDARAYCVRKATDLHRKIEIIQSN
jgi:hypothetical protein